MKLVPFVDFSILLTEPNKLLVHHITFISHFIHKLLNMRLQPLLVGCSVDWVKLDIV